MLRKTFLIFVTGLICASSSGYSYDFSVDGLRDEPDLENVEENVEENVLHQEAEYGLHYLDKKKDVYFRRLHPSAWYTSKFLPSNQFILTDGSLWSFSSEDSYKAMGWLESDVVHIRVNQSWLTAYKYELYNTATGEVIKVKNDAPATPYSLYGYVIQSINKKNRLIELSNGVFWFVPPGEKSFDRFITGDKVFIGVSHDLEFATYPNILINASITTMPYCKAVVGY